MTGTLILPEINLSSSRSVKENIEPFEDSALDIIKDIDIVSFNYKKDEAQVPQVGFIAEDTPKILSGEQQNNMKLNTTIGVLLKAIQELNEKIDRLTSAESQHKHRQ
jgi:hypothetical protein